MTEDTNKTVADIMNSTVTAERSREEKKGQKTALLSYIWWLCLIPLLLTNKDSKFVQNHAKSGFILAMIQSVWGVMYAIIMIVFRLIFSNANTWFVTYSISVVLSFFSFILLSLSVVGILKVLQYSNVENPIILKLINLVDKTITKKESEENKK